MEMLNLEDRPSFDESVEGIELHSHYPYASTKLQSGDEIRIAVQQQDIYTLPCESFLYLEGKFLKEDGTGLPPNAKLTQNAFAFLFDEIRYEICGTEVDRIKNPGISSTLKGLSSIKRGRINENAGWTSPESNNLSMNSTEGHFNACIPLRLLLGFAEDYQKVIINVKQELILIRSRRDENSYISTDAAEKAKIELTNLSWKIHYLNLNEYQRLLMLRQLKKENIISVPFRSWELYDYPLLPTAQRQLWAVKTSTQMEKPRFVFLAFQTKRKNISVLDSSKFDHCCLTNVKLFLNSKSYPYDDLNVNFSTNQYGMLYYMYSNFQKSFYAEPNPSPLLSLSQFRDDAPIIVIDCSKQSESIKTGPVDVRLEFEASKPFPPDTTAYCLIIHDRIIEYNPLTNIVRRMV